MLKNDYAVMPDGTTVVYVYSQKHGTQLVLMDWVDFDRLEGRACVVQHDARYGLYANLSNGQAQRTMPLHRSVLVDETAVHIDHKDGDGLNNTRANLRAATRAQNHWNRRKSSHNTSGYKGVTWNKQHRRWRAYVVANGKKRYLGHFDDPEAAACAYDTAARELHGVFARTNFPDPP